MDLMISNVIVDNPVQENRPDHARVKRKGSFNNVGSGFSITLNNSLPSKAIVVRKRHVVKVPPKPTESKTAHPTIKQAIEIPSNEKHKNVAITDCISIERKVKATGSNSNLKNASHNNQHKTPKSHNSEAKISPLIQHGVDEQNDGENSSSNFQRATRPDKSSMFERFKLDLPKLNLPHVQPLEEQVFSEQSIESLDIHPHSKKNIIDMLNYTHLTTVQTMAIPHLMEGRDALIRAQTGSGKTLAYALPLIEQLHKTRPKTCRTDGILAVIIVPTRELALQTYELMVKLLKPYTWIVSGFLCGGEKRKTEKARLRAGLNILIGTPGRFCDHIRNTENLRLKNVRWLVLDEADRLLELGYETDVKEIVNAIQSGWVNADENGENFTQTGSLQTVLLSATLTASVKELAGLALRNPVYVETSESIRKRQAQVETGDGSAGSCDYLLNVNECVSIPSTVKQRYLVIPPKLRLVTLCGLIAQEQDIKPSKSLIFMATQDLVDFHYNVMVEVLTCKQLDSDDENDDIEETDETVLLPKVVFFKLHGGMTQVERSSVFLKFRNTKSAVLLCTDMVARGIDIPCVDLVVQYHAPQILADYVHRVGRTARAGHTGKAVLFIDPAEVDFIKYLADKQISIREQKVDGIFVNLGQRLKCGQKTIAKNKEQAAIVLQRRFEQHIVKDKDLFSSASKAFVSWVRYYSNFPRELRRIFAIKAIHMGHYAQCLGLRDAPKQFMHAHTGPKDADSSNTPEQKKSRLATNRSGRSLLHRSTGTAGAKQREKRDAGAGQSMADFAKRSRVFNTSEFDSGLQPTRKRAKQS